MPLRHRIGRRCLHRVNGAGHVLVANAFFGRPVAARARVVDDGRATGLTRGQVAGFFFLSHVDTP
jgi:hypothetical protein